MLQLIQYTVPGQAPTVPVPASTVPEQAQHIRLLSILKALGTGHLETGFVSTSTNLSLILGKQYVKTHKSVI